MDLRYSECLGWFYRRHPNRIKQFIQSVSPKQIKNKKWLVDELVMLNKNFNKIQLYGGWFGYPIIDFLDNAFSINYLINIDCDHDAILVNKRFSKEYFNHNFVDYSKHKVEDYNGDFTNIDLVINTSSEHMKDLPYLIHNKKYNTECIFAIQSNNMFDIDDHFNCVESEDELIKKSKLNKRLYKGKIKFDNYERYMVIGLF